MAKNKKIILQREQVQISSSRLVDLSTLSEAAFNEEVERGYAGWTDQKCRKGLF